MLTRILPQLSRKRIVAGLFVVFSVALAIVAISQRVRREATSARIREVGGYTLSRAPMRFGNRIIENTIGRFVSPRKRVTAVELGYSSVTDSDLEGLGCFTHLEALSLNHNPQINDQSLKQLVRLGQLRRLWLYDTNVTGEGIAMLQTALPQLHIKHNVPVSTETKR